MSEGQSLPAADQDKTDPVDLLRNSTPLIDLRAPAEFAKGALPNATNLPLLNDEERARVGLTYKSHGQVKAIEVAEQLISGDTKQARLDAWQQYLRRHPDAWIYCWRGGLRSLTVQQWLAALGISVPRVPGGFKALRGICLSVLDSAAHKKRWLVVAGRTGSGKTRLLHRTASAIDLEGFANHRGSAFGAQTTPQPAQVGFENALAQAFLQHQPELLLLEDESRTIGRLAIPQAWHEKMQRSGLIILQADLATRCANIAREYVTEPQSAGISDAALLQRFTTALDKIARRLGGVRHKFVKAELEQAFRSGDHSRWIERLLVWYYDPMYDYQLSKKRERVLISGDAETLLDFIASA